MWRFVFIAFLIAHGGLHLAIWLTPQSEEAPFEAARSWLFGTQRPLAMAVAVIAAAALVAAGVGLWAQAQWWRPAAVVGLGVSFVLMVLYFHPWFIPIQVINAALIVGLVWRSWPTESLVGA